MTDDLPEIEHRDRVGTPTRAVEDRRWLLAEVARLAAIVEEYGPRCLGTWLSGSGGHRVHAVDCDRLATWWDPDDLHTYCDEHVPEADRRLPWRSQAGMRVTPQT